ncbi:hypothetical protein [Arthrobacter sp. MA-N2]|uniref:hypothetical protein n=1 Tax=Arthrobacter sp. MA-N2 TaxID=1101188 RepID=UPI0004862E17|nr:hypothetical protein [Arthrobacter sp. MA-N2]
MGHKLFYGGDEIRLHDHEDLTILKETIHYALEARDPSFVVIKNQSGDRVHLLITPGVAVRIDEYAEHGIQA